MLLAALPIPDLTEHLPKVLFWVFSLIAVGGAIFAAVARKIVHAAFSLIGAFFGVAGLYGLLGADFLAFSQVLVYIGGILILLVFGILLTGRVRGTLGREKPEKRLGPVLVGGLLFVGLLMAFKGTTWPGAMQESEPAPTAASLGRALLDPDRFLVPFELVSVLLLAALIGAAYLARRRRDA